MPSCPPARAVLRLAPAVLSALLVAPPLPAQEGAPSLGEIRFPVTATPAARDEFRRGVLYLHSFMYMEAQAAFARARTLDPSAPLIAAFEAFSFTAPVWNGQDTAKARDALRRLAPTRPARVALARTPRERAWIDAIETLYDGDTPKAVRDTAFTAALAALHAAEPRDAEAATFYALALLGLNQGEREPVAYARAEAIVDTVLRRRPRHPGALHYKIHAVDDPANAVRGLGAARLYGDVAAGAHHALHMTSHIYIARGMWAEVERDNRRALAAAGRLVGHYAQWLAYALLQRGRPTEARAIVDSMWALAGGGQGTRDARAHALPMANAWIADAAAWDDALAAAPTDTLIPWSLALTVSADFLPGYAAAVRAGRGPAGASARDADRQRAAHHLERITARLARARDAADARDAGEADVLALLLRGELAASDGRTDDAIATFRAAAERWEAIPFAFGPPAVIVPPRERLARALLAAGRPAEALAEAEAGERMTPGRAQLLAVRARALAHLGRDAESRRLVDELRERWRGAEPGWGTEVAAGDR